MTIQRFFSDNAARVHPRVMEAIASANHPDTAYDGDALSARLDDAFSGLFETRCTALWVTTGTAANAIALAHYARPWQGVICHEEAHIEVDECGAPAMYSGGAKLILASGDGAKVSPETIAEKCAGIRPDVHQVQPAAVSITNASEYGLAWRPDEVAAVGEACRAHGLKLHMDGARFANAAAFIGASPADLTWRAGVDALSFGFVKNGGMNAEALVFFGDKDLSGVHELRKRGGHLMSKGRFAAAQLLAMLDDDLWLANARAANAGGALIAQAAGDRLMYRVEANELFVRLSADEAASLRAQGFDFYDWGSGAARLVTSWDQDAAAVAPLADALRAL
jgi:threonine aldolase